MSRSRLDLPPRAAAQTLLRAFPPDRFDAERDDYRLMDALYEHGFVMPDFDWMHWEEGAERGQDRGWILALDYESLCKLFTGHARNDRFCENHWDVIGRDGVLTAMLQRLQELLDEGAVPEGRGRRRRARSARPDPAP